MTMWSSSVLSEFFQGFPLQFLSDNDGYLHQIQIVVDDKSNIRLINLTNQTCRSSAGPGTTGGAIV